MYTVAIELGTLVFIGVCLYLFVRVVELRRKKENGE